MNKEQLKELIRFARDNQVKPGKITSHIQAIQFTLKSRFKQIWHKGDEYYLFMANNTQAHIKVHSVT